MAGHSPTPWHRNGNLICTGEVGVGEIVATVGTEGGRWRPGDAELIVNAVNAYADLVAACRELLGHVEAEHGLEGAAIGPEDADDPGWTGAVFRARAALAKATVASP